MSQKSRVGQIVREWILHRNPNGSSNSTREFPGRALMEPSSAGRALGRKSFRFILLITIEDKPVVITVTLFER
jgi:hypothetical protein